jgi:hypothetical protein
MRYLQFLLGPLVAKVKALVTYFHSSSQAMEKLIKEQEHMGMKSPLKPKQDVRTRFWSTQQMLSSVLKLKTPIQVLLTRRAIDVVCTLTESEWIIVELLVEILDPFRSAQLSLEADKYVTASLIPYLIYSLRSKLLALEEKFIPKLVARSTVVVPDDEKGNNDVVALVRDMLQHFRAIFGDEGTPVFSANVRRGDRRFRCGIPPKSIAAALLDPRRKSLGINIAEVDTAFAYLKTQAQHFFSSDSDSGGSSEGELEGRSMIYLNISCILIASHQIFTSCLFLLLPTGSPTGYYDYTPFC